MIAPALYFATVPHGDLIRDRLAKKNHPRPIALRGSNHEVLKFLAAVRTAYPHLAIVSAAEFRETTLPELDDIYGTTMIVVGLDRPAKYVDAFTLPDSPYTTRQILGQLGGSPKHLTAMTTLVAAEVLGPLSLSQIIELETIRADTPGPLQSKARFRVKYLQQKEKMFTPDQIKNMTPEEYRANRARIMDPRHKAEVQAQVDHARRVERQQAIARDPEGHKLKALQQQRDDAAKRGRNTSGIDADIERIAANKAAREKSESFLSSDEYAAVIETSQTLRDLVAQHDPNSLVAVDAAYEMYTQHQDSDRFTSELVSASKSAWMTDLRLRREAEHASVKAAHELAQSDLARAEASQGNAKLDALMGEQN